MSHTTSRGYIGIWMPNHFRANSQGRVLEHLVIAEAALGHPLPDGAEVHHVNEIKSDNRHENLVICEDSDYHKLLHRRARAYRATGNAQSRKCVYCKAWMLPSDPELRITGTSRYPSGRSYHLTCEREALRARRAAGYIAPQRRK